MGQTVSLFLRNIQTNHVMCAIGVENLFCFKSHFHLPNLEDSEDSEEEVVSSTKMKGFPKVSQKTSEAAAVFEELLTSGLYEREAMDDEEVIAALQGMKNPTAEKVVNAVQEKRRDRNTSLSQRFVKMRKRIMALKNKKK